MSAAIKKYWNVNRLRQNKNLSPVCQTCIANRVTKEDLLATDGEILHSAGDFVIKCRGIPADYTKIWPAHMWNDLSAEEQEDFLELYDPVYWAWKFMDWVPRWSKDRTSCYQGDMLRCTSPRKVYRAGRRIGKSECMAIAMLHYITTHSASDRSLAATGYDRTGKILLYTPRKAQAGEIFDRFEELIDRSAPIQNAISRYIKNPLRLQFAAGGRILSHTAGSGQKGTGNITVRGAGANVIVLDELDYIDDLSIEAAVNPILQENPDVEIWSSSTPRGRREGPFYSYCQNPRYKEFHLPCTISPKWNKEVEAEILADTPWEVFNREYLANWGSAEEGVFAQKAIDIAISTEYNYNKCQYDPECFYMIGVDWNENTANEIITVEGHPERGLRVVDVTSVDELSEEDIKAHRGKQSKACASIVELNRKWKPHAIYLDLGYGRVQYEMLHQIGAQARAKFKQAGGDRSFIMRDAKLLEIVKGINFSSTIEVKDPFLQEKRSVRLKQYMVHNAVKRFEEGRIKIPVKDKILKSQLENYIILRTGTTGAVYGPRSEKIGDHRVDALMLALLAFTQELSWLGKDMVDTSIILSKGRLYTGTDFVNRASIDSNTTKQPPSYDPTDPDNELYVHTHPKHVSGDGFAGREQITDNKSNIQSRVIQENHLQGPQIGSIRGASNPMRRRQI